MHNLVWNVFFLNEKKFIVELQHEDLIKITDNVKNEII